MNLVIFSKAKYLKIEREKEFGKFSQWPDVSFDKVPCLFDYHKLNINQSHKKSISFTKILAKAIIRGNGIYLLVSVTKKQNFRRSILKTSIVNFIHKHVVAIASARLPYNRSLCKEKMYRQLRPMCGSSEDRK